MAAPSPIKLNDLRPGRPFNILAAMFVIDANGNEVPITTDNISGISYTVYQRLDVLPPDITSGAIISGSGSFVPSAVISNSMITGTIWTKSSPPNVSRGYNANFPFPGSFIPYQNTVYEIQITTVLTSGLSFDDWYITKTLDMP